MFSSFLSPLCAKFRAAIGSRRLRVELAAGLGLLIALVLGLIFGQFCAVSASVRADTLRLHVVANSDSEADQTLKLQVRDAVVQCAGKLFATAEDEAAAQRIAAENLETLRASAETALRAAGSAQNVRVRLVKMPFPTTAYQDFTLPAGDYMAVRVELGAAKGHNWFCVLYPALCLPAAVCREYPQTAENALIAGDYEIRFAALEWAQKLNSGRNA